MEVFGSATLSQFPLSSLLPSISSFLPFFFQTERRNKEGDWKRTHIYIFLFEFDSRYLQWSLIASFFIYLFHFVKLFNTHTLSLSLSLSLSLYLSIYLSSFAFLSFFLYLYTFHSPNNFSTNIFFILCNLRYFKFSLSLSLSPLFPLQHIS